MENVNPLTAYIEEYNEVLQKCFPAKKYSLEIEPGWNTDKWEEMTLILKRNSTRVAKVTINIKNVDEHAQEFVKLVKDASLLRRPVKIGYMDSNTDVGASSGYNRLLRTIGYNMMHDVANCQIMTTYAVNPVSLHILSKYFHWTIEAGEETMDEIEFIEESERQDKELDAQGVDDIFHSPGKVRRRQNIRRLLEISQSNIPLLEKIKQVLRDYYNACVDLTDPEKLAATRFMLSQVLQCKCPPCDDTYKAAVQKATVFRRRRLAGGKKRKIGHARKPLIRRASSTRKRRYSQPRRRRVCTRNPLRVNK